MYKVKENVGTNFDIFKKPAQTDVIYTITTWYHPTSSVSQSDQKFLIPGDSENYVDTLIKFYVRDKFSNSDGTDFDASDHTALPTTSFTLSSLNTTSP
jgi:hypothetical protein